MSKVRKDKEGKNVASNYKTITDLGFLIVATVMYVVNFIITKLTRSTFPLFPLSGWNLLESSGWDQVFRNVSVALVWFIKGSTYSTVFSISWCLALLDLLSVLI